MARPRSAANSWKMGGKLEGSQSPKCSSVVFAENKIKREITRREGMKVFRYV